MPRVEHPAELVRARVAHADRLRRMRDAARRRWRVAPFGAAVALAVALLGRLAAWPSAVAIAALAVMALLLLLALVVARRNRDVSDAAAAAIDDHASLDGELRSAHWFARHRVSAVASAEAGDPWIEFHLARAVERMQGIDWLRLYPAPRAGRAKLVTAGLTIGALAIALFVPGRAGASAGAGRTAAAKTAAKKAAPLAIESLTPELLEQLEAMLNAAEQGQGTALTASQVKGLLDQLEKLRSDQNAGKPQQPAKPAAKPSELTEADVKAFAERTRRASEMTSLQPEVRDALADVADRLMDAKQTQASNPKDAQQAAAAKESQQGESAQTSNGGGKDDASSQSVKEAAGGGGIGVIMMATESSANSKEAGLGLGGGTGQDKNGGGRLTDLGAALRKETIEASVDNPGENVLTGIKRKSEQGDATVGFTHAAGTAERGRSTAPPPVPESRRAAVRSYFIRKQ